MLIEKYRVEILVNNEWVLSFKTNDLDRALSVFEHGNKDVAFRVLEVKYDLVAEGFGREGGGE